MYRVNHIHLRSPDPRATAQWYVENFDARILSEGQGLAGSLVVRMEFGGVSVNVSGSPTGQPIPDGVSGYHWGLEHFGLDTDDIAGTLERLEVKGVQVTLPITKMASGSHIAYIKGPDDVMIELVEPLRQT